MNTVTAYALPKLTAVAVADALKCKLPRIMVLVKHLSEKGMVLEENLAPVPIPFFNAMMAKAAHDRRQTG